MLSSCYATSIISRQTLGSQPGAPLHRIGRDPDAPWVQFRDPLQANLDGFDLHAALTVEAQHAQGRLPLEKFLRYCARPPISHDRLSLLEDGKIALELKTPWSDGSTHIVYEPLDLIAKLAALVPRPHKNLILYHGVLSPHAAWRARAVAYGRKPDVSDCDRAAAFAQREHVAPDLDADPDGLQRATVDPLVARKRRQWSDLVRRAFGYDLLSCPECGGKMALVACVLDPQAIGKILKHLGLPTEAPRLAPARASPNPSDLPFEQVN